MPSEDASVRVSKLVKDGLDYFDKGNVEDAGRAIREASSINPDSLEVKNALEKIQSDHKGSDLPALCLKFIDSLDESDIDAALDYYHEHPETSNDSIKEAMTALMEYGGESDTADELTGELLKKLPAKLVLESRLKSAPTVTFNKLYERGDDSIDGQTDVLLDATAWNTEAERIAAERDVYQLCLAQLMKAGQDYPGRAMKSLSRLLVAESENLTGLMDADGFDAILSNLDIRLPASLRSHTSLAILKLLEETPEIAKILISQYVVQRIEKPTGERLVQALSAAAAIFPMEPRAASELFLTSGFLQGFLKLLKKWKSRSVEQAALELLNAACMDTACRDAIRKYCPEWLDAVTSAGEVDHRRLSQVTMANLVLEKIKDNKLEGEDPSAPSVEDRHTQEQRISRFRGVITDTSPSIESKTSAVEGLAYASMQPWVKDILAKDGAFLKSLVELVANGSLNKSTIFGVMSILANITAYRIVLSEEQKKLVELKAYANSKKPTPEDPLDSEDTVTLRCKKVLDSSVIPLLSQKLKTFSLAAQTQALLMINALAQDKSHRGTLTQQGALKLLLQTHSSLQTQSPTNNAASLTAAHALARILISVNPAHAFGSSSASPSTAIRPLTTLLKPDDSSDGPRNLLPTFEALLALTNLASTNTETCNAIVRTSWSVIEDDLLLSNNEMVQRASVELICNLCASPLGASQYASGSRAGPRLKTLLALSDADDLPTRRAAAGALAMLSEWDGVVDNLLVVDERMEKCMRLLDDERPEVVVRGAVVVVNMLEVRKERVKPIVVREENVEVIERAFRGGDGQVEEAIGGILQALK